MSGEKVLFSLTGRRRFVRSIEAGKRAGQQTSHRHDFGLRRLIKSNLDVRGQLFFLEDVADGACL